ncbi:MAG TPA: GPW/gp25 family protein [Candidatus Dormibacteraeota bacterium]
MNDDFIGSGWAFPLCTDARGGIALVARERELEKCMRLILSTAPGERPMRPDFGCAIHERVFDVADSSIAGAIAADVEAALLRWEPRVVVQDVEVIIDRDVPGLVHIDIRYTAKSTNDPRNLVFPFYSIPGEGGE